MAINLTDKLTAATGDKVLVDAIQVAGGYMEVANDAARNALTSAVCVQGTLVYVTETKKTYRRLASSWEEVDISPVGNKTINGNLEVTGNLTVQGEGVLSHLEDVTTEQNTITLRKNATASLGTNEYTGIVAKKYDGTNDGMLVFDKAGTAYVGDAGNIQPLATRAPESALTDKHLLMWDATNHRIADSNNVVVHLDGGTATSAW